MGHSSLGAVGVSRSARGQLTALACFATLAGCRSPTQITVQVSTNVPCSAWQGAAISVGELGPTLETKPAATTSTYCGANGYLGSVVAVPSGAENASVAFRIVGAVGETLEECTENPANGGCIVARRALNFIPNDTLTLSVPLLSSCEGIVCDPESTCVQGTCRPATIADPSACAASACGEGALSPPDGGADGGLDATTGEGGTGGDDGGGPDATLPTEAGPTGDGGGASDGASAFDASAAGCGTACALALGEGSTCALRNGTVSCWGQNFLGELGNGTQQSPGTPSAVLAAASTPVTGVQGITAGFRSSCAFFAGGAVSCWGAGAPIERPSNTAVPFATPESFLQGANAVSIADYHSCWQTGATVSCTTFGTTEINAFGDLDAGDDATVTAVLPAAPDAAPGPFAQLGASLSATCVLDGAGNVYCLGGNDSNQSDPAEGSPSGTLTAFNHVAIPGSTPVQEIGVLDEAACARSLGHVFCWGTGYQSARGGLPDGGSATMNEIVYADGSPVTDAVRLATGEYHTCALLSTSQIACWGFNGSHQLGRGEPVTGQGVDSTVAQVVPLADGGPFAGITDVASGGNHSCALTSDGTLWCWGSNDYGESAPTDSTARSSPTAVTF